jgi:hypothetical protein
MRRKRRRIRIHTERMGPSTKRGKHLRLIIMYF